MVPRLRLFERPVPFHLLLGPLTLPLAVIADNMQLAPPLPSIWSIAAVWIVILVVVGGLTCLTRNVRTSAAVVAVVTIAFFVDFAEPGVGRVADVVSAAIWIGAAIIAIVLVYRRREAPILTVFANILFLGMTVGFCAEIVVFSFAPMPVPKADRLRLSAGDQAARPDVYLFVLDGYTRTDVLRRLYRHEDRFVSVLRREGFYVADRGTSNYAQTALSLASSLNLDYLPDLMEGVPGDSASREPCHMLIADNRTFRALRRAGYRIATFASEYSMLTFRDVDKYYAPPFFLTDFGQSVFTAGAAPAFFRLVGLPQAFLPHQVRRYQIQWTFEHLSRGVTAADSPTFVFVHIMLPHPPFVFRTDGSYTWTSARAGTQDADHWRAADADAHDSYEAGYTGNLSFLESHLAPIIRGILAAARRPTVMVIQGDHGSGSRLVWDNAAASDMNERLAILLAVKSTDGQNLPAYPTMTPVNTMRLVLNHALDANLPLLDDRAWFSTWSHPYRFIDVTNQAHDHVN